MITNYWIEKGISALLLVLLVVLGYLSFGYPVYFDRLFIVLLICCIAFYKIDKNIASIGASMLIVRITSDVLFNYEGAYQEVFFYSISFIVVYRLKFDKQINLLLLPILVICCLAELFWAYIDYESPQLSPYILGIALNCVLRYLLVSRVHLALQFLKIHLSGITLDFDLYRLIGVYNLVITLMVFEYLIRHLTPLNPLVIYELYSYCLQIVTLMFPYLVIHYLIKSRFKIYA